MTRLALIDDDQALEFFRALLGAEPARETAIAELIRAEVSARGFCQRATTVRRICRFAAPVVNLDVAMVNDLCTQLEREGDILMADAGLLVAPPLTRDRFGAGPLSSGDQPDHAATTDPPARLLGVGGYRADLPGGECGALPCPGGRNGGQGPHSGGLGVPGPGSGRGPSLVGWA